MATRKKVPAKKEAGVPSYIKNQQGAGRGSENVNQDDLQLPRLTILQALSEQVMEDEPGYIEGAKPGMIFNTLTGEHWDGKQGILIVPVHFQKQYLVWQAQEAGGGLKGVFESAEAAASAITDHGTTEKGNPVQEVVDTPQHLVLICDDEGNPLEQVMMPLTKTKAKISRKWNSLIQMAGGDRFSRCYRLRTVTERNADNQAYYNFEITPVGWATEEAYKQGESLYESIATGEVRAGADYSNGREETSAPAF